MGIANSLNRQPFCIPALDRNIYACINGGERRCRTTPQVYRTQQCTNTFCEYWAYLATIATKEANPSNALIELVTSFSHNIRQVMVVGLVRKGGGLW